MQEHKHTHTHSLPLTPAPSRPPCPSVARPTADGAPTSKDPPRGDPALSGFANLSRAMRMFGAATFLIYLDSITTCDCALRHDAPFSLDADWREIRWHGQSMSSGVGNGFDPLGTDADDIMAASLLGWPVSVPPFEAVGCFQVPSCPSNMSMEEHARLAVLDSANVYTEMQFAECECGF